MKNLRNFRTAGAIAIIIMAASAISMANISETETEPNPKSLVPSELVSWTFLGSNGFSLGNDKRTIRLTRGFGKMAKIQLRLRFNSINIDSAELHFKNGETQKVELKPNVLGERIYLIDVEGGAQKIRKVTVWTSAKDNLEGYNEDYDMVEVWGVTSRYLRSGYNEIRYPTVRYATFDDIVRRELPRNQVSSIHCPR